MKNNIILSTSTIILQIFRILIAIAAGVQVTVFIGISIFNYSPTDLITTSESIIQIQGIQVQGIYNLHNLTLSNFWLTLLMSLQNIVLLIIFFQILGYGIDIIKNIHSLRTFTKDNVQAFGRISVLAIMLIIVQFIKLSPEKIGISIEFSYVFFALAAIILTQVFREGQRLLQENELTV